MPHVSPLDAFREAIGRNVRLHSFPIEPRLIEPHETPPARAGFPKRVLNLEIAVWQATTE